MTSLLDFHWLSAAFVFLVQFILFVRWLYKRVRDDEINRVFVRDMAINHLPHIYEVLQQICARQGIAADKPLVVRWVNLDD